MLPKARIVHQIENRVRIQVPEFRKVESFFSDAVKTLRLFEDVESVEANPLTASLVILYRGALEPLIEYAKEHDLFEVLPETRTPHSWVSDVFGRIDDVDVKIARSTDGSFDLASTAALGFLGLSVIQFFRKQYLPAASTLLFDAFQILYQAKEPNRRTVASRG